ncbi:MAG: radical SAM protein [Candidatus Lokiarchaeota archaeon]|nr:radical SAM protein [Candidatus Lokiarchaeota archaeon]
MKQHPIQHMLKSEFIKLEEKEDSFLSEFNNKVIKLFKNAFWKSKSLKYKVFLLKTIIFQRKATRRRAKYNLHGTHVPAFLIFSVTHRCNLRCKGCYANTFRDLSGIPPKELELNKMEQILGEANDAGSNIVLLAGGEPFVRVKELFHLATKFPQIIFPVFTNGTLLNQDIIQTLKKHRNIIPVLSIEGHMVETDARRGEGIYKNILNVMQLLNQNAIFFGTSITLTRKNFTLVTNQSFIESILGYGCKLFFYIDYVPVISGTEELMLTEEQAESIPQITTKYQSEYPALFIGFPGDEEKMGGCLSSGRGFFHISPEGYVEPCPFAPVQAADLNEVSFLDALQSPLLKAIRANHDKLVETQSGCALWENQEWLRDLNLQVKAKKVTPG